MEHRDTLIEVERREAPPPGSTRRGAPADATNILFSSGTTGDPKAILSTYGRYAVSATLPALFGLDENDRPYTGLSLTHANAQIVTLGMILHTGMRGVISRKFTKSRLWDITRHYGCTFFNLLGENRVVTYQKEE